VLKHDHRLLLDGLVARARREVADSVSHVRSALGPEVFQATMHPARVPVEPVHNPYDYRYFRRDPAPGG
jgi:hypothetical protein